jgi:small nuclear ribonucleoprotein (snRNP)-like protein
MHVDRLEINKLIVEASASVDKPFIMRVMCKNDVNYYGYFNAFDDYEKLQEKNQYRFIPRNNVHSFNSEYSKKGKYNANHSIILNGEDIINIEFVLPLHI